MNEEEPKQTAILKLEIADNVYHRISIDRNMSVGTDKKNDIVLIDSVASPHHANFQYSPNHQEGIVSIQDLGNLISTQVNGAEQENTVTFLKNKDVIRIGKTKIVFRFLEEDDSFILVDLVNRSISDYDVDEVIDAPSALFLFPADNYVLEKLYEIITEKLETLPLSEKDKNNMESAINEAIGNALKHGCNYDTEKTIQLFFTCMEDYLEVKIIDEGEGFDFRSEFKKRQTNKGYRQGVGLSVMQDSADELEFFGNGNEVILTKNFPKAVDHDAKTSPKGKQAEDVPTPIEETFEEPEIVADPPKKEEKPEEEKKQPEKEPLDQDLQKEEKEKSGKDKEKSIKDKEKSGKDKEKSGKEKSEKEKEKSSKDKEKSGKEKERPLEEISKTPPKETQETQDKSPSEKTETKETVTFAPAKGLAKVTIDYYTQMRCFKHSLLKVTFPKEAVKKIRDSASSLIDGKNRSFVKRDYPVEVIPLFPGCICTPQKVELDTTLNEIKTEFWITPHTDGYLRDAKVEFRCKGKLIHAITTPTQIKKSGWSVNLLWLAFIIPILSALLEILEKNQGELSGILNVLRSILKLGGTHSFWLFAFAVGAATIHQLHRPKKGHTDMFLDG